ncbi:hypothetical protein [uncultured Microscilla sp.]|uniref:hypothetical protein n=1 Tax=uncultured Microscilla sp. TaxID=432653 RepID=UPI002611BB69|nr:hypothetical protein [uncultured Microscilla sp.]
MKQFILTMFLSLSIASLSQGQDNPTTLFGGSGNMKISGFGGPTVSLGVIDGSIAMFNGGGGAIMFNNFFFGGYGSNMSFSTVTRSVGGENLRLRMRQGGLWFGYDAQAHKLVHLTSSLKMGWGHLRFYRSTTSFYDDTQSVLREHFFMLTPEAGIEVNITKFMKIALTGGYRIGFSNTIKEDDNSRINLNGQYMALTFKFGWFGKSGPITEIKKLIKD